MVLQGLRTKLYRDGRGLAERKELLEGDSEAIRETALKPEGEIKETRHRKNPGSTFPLPPPPKNQQNPPKPEGVGVCCC